MSDSDVGALCQACALCCDGSLFTRVPLTVEEQVPEVELGVVRNAQGGRHVPQRCAALEGCRCTQYAGRPLACRRFECFQVVALREGEASLSEALALVRRAQDLVARARVDAAVAPERDAYLSFHFARRP